MQKFAKQYAGVQCDNCGRVMREASPKKCPHCGDVFCHTCVVSGDYATHVFVHEKALVKKRVKDRVKELKQGRFLN